MRKNFRSNNGGRPNMNNRGGGGRNNNGRRSSGGGHDHQSLARQKKHAQTQKEKYLNLARDSQMNGDRVDVEYFFQHVEHYSRTIAEIEAKEAEHAPRQSVEHHDDAQDDGDESEAQAAAEDAQPAPKKARPPRQKPARQETEATADEADASDKPRRGRPRKAKSDNDEIPLPAGMFAESEAASA
ncbi:MAG: hypothetical protein CMM93_00085 [Rickettsiales bacterium]|nr:hypothetical protein [Rickettsiales bacterium]